MPISTAASQPAQKDCQRLHHHATAAGAWSQHQWLRQRHLVASFCIVDVFSRAILVRCPTRHEHGQRRRRHIELPGAQNTLALTNATFHWPMCNALPRCLSCCAVAAMLERTQSIHFAPSMPWKAALCTPTARSASVAAQSLHIVDARPQPCLGAPPDAMPHSCAPQAAHAALPHRVDRGAAVSPALRWHPAPAPAAPPQSATPASSPRSLPPSP